MDTKKVIKKTKVAYKLGFSSSLNPNSFSGYNELAKVSELASLDQTKQRSFLLGFMDGVKARNEVMREFGKNFFAA